MNKVIKSDFPVFEKKIGVSFNDKDILKRAFTHRSYINENKSPKFSHNERLEFLGDAVLELASTEFLFKNFPDKQEGELTSLRAALVNTVSISKVASDLEINDYLLLSKGEAKDTGKARQVILADTFEALIGAIYLDKGYETAKKFIETNVLVKAEEIARDKIWQDPKSLLQERAQEEYGMTPTYETLKESGPDHNKIFIVGLFVGKEKIAEGRGRSKQEAQEDAARGALKEKGWS